eukprot:CAMPEP_0181312132 /NCGR_PEP_ID=MMETSP1101-20121128/13524_1 /TAXON_ID=46948 /ORGANISM="Rhodomonas abbreviata, Strain Caron Lab Isolate" /LENGTH=882 /DNA_ID=CAMNT_0023418943 /DNA_START=24 /DNA_END=2672 /DNA_ORIENTATION=-
MSLCSAAFDEAVCNLDKQDPVYKCVTRVTNEGPTNLPAVLDWGCDMYTATAPLDLTGSTQYFMVVVMGFVAALVSMAVVVIFTKIVLAADEGTERMKKIADTIHAGAKSFLHKEYYYLAIFVLVLFAILCGMLYSSAEVPCGETTEANCNPFIGTPDLSTQGVYTGICFVIGAIMSAAAGYFGMYIATKANVRTTQACSTSMNTGLSVAFKSGAVMGLTVVAFGLLGLSVLFLIFTVSTEDQRLVWQYISGFGFGASSIALFARVGGGIYTKAADVGADLVGKVEAGIPEDDPNNPAVIADNVGDNVGDVAGMGADLFESYVGSIIASATLGYDTYAKQGLSETEYCCIFGVSPATASVNGTYDESIFMTNYALNSVALPFYLSGFGVLCSIIGMKFVTTDADETMDNDVVLGKLLNSIRKGIYIASFLVIGVNAGVCYLVMGNSGQEWNLLGCTYIGLVAGNLIGAFTEYCTAYSEAPTQSIAEKSLTGPATVIIQGLGVGLLSTAFPMFVLVVTVIATNALSGRYGIAISAVSMLSTLGITLATDAYGPVADNAGGIAEMAGDDVDPATRDRTDALDAMGNTTAATGKGFAIGSAALTSIALISAFINAVGLNVVPVDDPVVLGGMLVGATLPFVFAALTMLSVGRAAEAIIVEVRDQFQKHPDLKTPGYVGPEGVPNYTKCIEISTEAALKEMIVPGAMAILFPPALGYLLGALGLVGMLVGSLVGGILLAITMANAGGAWDNAKKYVEKGGLGAGKGKGTDFHDATVVGDTVGDPFKDTSGPALNILVKMMSLISLVLAPSFRLINPTGEAFNADSWWIGLIIFVVAGFPIGWFAYTTAVGQSSLAEEVAGKAADAPAEEAEEASPEVIVDGDAVTQE